MKRLSRSFFIQPSLVVSKKLLGKYICTKVDGCMLCGMIVETESYPGPYDKASHAFNFKKTPRNEAEYREGGHIYIYMVYGMYWQLNISTGKKEYPECVLIRALEPVTELGLANKHEHPTNHTNKSIREIRAKIRAYSRVQTNGPGKLCRWLKLNKSFYGEDVTKSKRIWLEDRGVKIKSREIVSGPRIGIDYAGPKWAKKPWRFWIKKNPYVSA